MNWYRLLPICSTIPQTNALPIRKARLPSDTSGCIVWLSGNIFIRSNSMGNRRRKRPDFVFTTCLKREAAVPPSPVMMVREGWSRLSGKDIPPSENMYLKPSFDTRSIFFAPFSYFHFGSSSSEIKNSSGTKFSSTRLPPNVWRGPS